MVIFPGKFISLSVGDGVVWGLGSNRDLFYRQADYLIIFVFCHFLNQFWFKVHFFYKTRYVKGLRRSGIDKNTGNNWLRVEQPKETKIVFKQVLVTLVMFIIFDSDVEVEAMSFAMKSQVEVCGDTLVGSDKDNNLFFKTKTSSDVKGSFINLISLGWIQRYNVVQNN